MESCEIVFYPLALTDIICSVRVFLSVFLHALNEGIHFREKSSLGRRVDLNASSALLININSCHICVSLTLSTFVCIL